MWQDLVFFAGNAFSVMVLAPTLRDAMSSVPRGTSLPSSAIGIIYGVTFLTMGMTYSAAGSLLAGVMWALIAAFRSPSESVAEPIPDSPAASGRADPAD